MKIVYTAEFEKRFLKLTKVVKKRAVKQEALFRTDPLHPSLHTEKLVPKTKQLWSLRIDKKYRIIFRQLDQNTFVFLTVGEHDWVYKYTNRL